MSAPVETQKEQLLRSCAIQVAQACLKVVEYTPLEKVALTTLVPTNSGNLNDAIVQAENAVASHELMTFFDPEIQKVGEFLEDFRAPLKGYSFDEIEHTFIRDGRVMLFFRAIRDNEQQYIAYGLSKKKTSRLSGRPYSVLENPILSLHKGAHTGIPGKEEVYIFKPMVDALCDDSFCDANPALAKYARFAKGLRENLKSLEQRSGLSLQNAINEVIAQYLERSQDPDILAYPGKLEGVTRMCFYDPPLDVLYRCATVMKHFSRKRFEVREMYATALLFVLVREVAFGKRSLMEVAPTIDSLLHPDSFKSQHDKIEEAKNWFYKPEHGMIKPHVLRFCWTYAKQVEEFLDSS